MYRVALQDFQGPLDLLLLLIQREEIDIFDIPIAYITDVYLEHVRELKDVDLDGVADFMYLAALLISIKVRMLLPQTEAATEELPDPRQELVDRLQMYLRYKEAADGLEQCYEGRAAFFTRGEASVLAEADMIIEPVNTTVIDLIRALRRILADDPKVPAMAMDLREYTQEEQRVYVLEALASRSVMVFGDLVRRRSKKFIIATFLAILELACAGRLSLTAGSSEDDFRIGIASPVNG